MKSKILSLLSFRVIYIAIALTITLLISENIMYCAVIPFYGFYLWKIHKKILYFIVVIILVYGGSRALFNQSSIEIDAQYEVKVIKVKHKDDYTTFTGSIDGDLVNVYLSDIQQIRPGDLYIVKGELREPLNQTVPGTFDYKKYLLSKQIKYQLFAEEMELVETSFHYGVISYEIERYIERATPLSKAYIKTFILGDKSDFDQSTIDSINILGISHLFAVSGLHVVLLVFGVKKILEVLNVRELWINIILSGLLLLYMVVTSFSPSIVRAGFMFILLTINQKYDKPFSALDILSFIYIILLILNPYAYYNLGFVLSFLVTASLILNSHIFQNKTNIHQLFLVGYVSLIMTFPIVMNMNHQINLLTLIFNILFILYMTYIILPLSYITFLIPFLDIILNTFIKGYNHTIIMFSRIDQFLIKGAFTMTWEIILFYIIIMYYMSIFNDKKQRKTVFVCLVLFTMFVLHDNEFSPITRVTFIDVKGDSTLIQDKFNNCNILIDTGDIDPSNKVIHYIRSNNIKRLDYLIISHYHSDHSGEMDDILQEFNVINIIDSNNVDMYPNSISCGSIQMYIYDLSTGYENINNNSLVMSVDVLGTHYLFTGDMEIEREREFLSLYDIDVDYLKVAHHGSSTSSSNEFIKRIDPEEAYIIVYRYNIFDQPDFSIINRLEQQGIEVHRTDLLGTIEIEYFFGKERKKYAKPN